VERTAIAGETEVLGENLPQRHFVPPQIPHDQERSGGKPATNRLSYGAAFSESAFVVCYVSTGHTTKPELDAFLQDYVYPPPIN
jgi:hypothetical protein